jgi:transposase
MGRHAGLQLSRAQRRQLRRFMNKTKNKSEFRAAQGLLLRAEEKSVEEIARHFGVTMKQVFVWTRKFRIGGVDGLRVKKQTGRPATKARFAKPRIEELIDEDPQVFGYLKGRWVLRDIACELKKEGVDIHYSSVHRILGDLGIGLKSPKLRAPGSIKKNYRKREQIGRYKRIAPALFKKKFSSDSKTRSGPTSSRKSSGVGLEKARRNISAPSVTQNA